MLSSLRFRRVGRCRSALPVEHVADAIEEAIDALFQSCALAPLLPCVDQAEYGDDDPEYQRGDEDRLNGCRHRNMVSDVAVETLTASLSVHSDRILVPALSQSWMIAP